MKESSLSDYVVMACAISVTAIAGYRQFGASKNLGTPTAKPAEVKEWDQVLNDSRLIFGDHSRPVQLVVFSDFECPACTVFATKSLKGIEAEFPEDVAVSYRHWPLSYHHLARPTAEAAECAAEQGNFSSFYTVIFAKHDSLGIKSFQSYASESGITDTVAFNACLASDRPSPRINKDISTAAAVGAQGTPTILLNGKRYEGLADSSRLMEVVQKLVREGRQ